jgi:biopolymer transport protein ExbB/TolQ
MHVPIFLLADSDLIYVWGKATLEAKAIIVILGIFSIFAWSVMAAKALQMRRAKKLNHYFDAEFRSQKHVLEVYDRRLQVTDCPLFAVYQEGCKELDTRLRPAGSSARRPNVSIKVMEHIKRTLERTVAQQAIKLESGLIMLAIAVSGAPFLGLLGTVWGVMATFSGIAAAAARGGKADLAAMAPGVSAALITTVAGLLVAIPSMFGYNWLVHNLRVITVELDNFAQELTSKIETEYLRDEDME